MTEEKDRTSAPAVVSIDLELATVAGATRGAQLLADLLANKALDDEHEREAPSGIFSILALVTERIGQLRRVIRSEESPAHLWAPHNAVEDPTTSGEFPGDIVLFASGPLRFPLIMWSAQGEEVAARQEAKGRTEPRRKTKGQKSRDAAPEVTEGKPAVESESPPPAAHDREHQNG
ncbi:hypothetical protein BHS06_01940 [Myxococcus xanthus]|uniref:hypothetical protein n=1 Tax=Myxococcus xanthus TaxID=34 RepID=UPI001126F91F|nr:hypothetical protein [Myxococcus xanthus]QDE87801.1 hypothetical protein BHS06_01940 [Myxococcus xanthus]